MRTFNTDFTYCTGKGASGKVCGKIKACRRSRDYRKAPGPPANERIWFVDADVCMQMKHIMFTK